jgi:hypothetical protein
VFALHARGITRRSDETAARRRGTHLETLDRMEPVPTEQVHPKPKRAINDWENEGGATPYDFSAGREEVHVVTARLRQTAFRLADEVRARPLLSIAAAVGVGIVLGAGLLGRNAKASGILGLLVAPTLKKIFASA